MRVELLFRWNIFVCQVMLFFHVAVAHFMRAILHFQGKATPWLFSEQIFRMRARTWCRSCSHYMQQQLALVALKERLGGGGRPTGKSCATFWIWAGWRLCGFHAASLFLPVCKNARWWWLGFHSSKVSEGGSNKSDILGSLHCHSAVTLPRLSRQTSSCIASQVGVNALDFRRGTRGIGAFVCPCQCEGVVAMNHSPNPPVLAQPCLWTKRQSLWKRWGLFPSWWKDYWKDYNIH